MWGEGWVLRRRETARAIRTAQSFREAWLR